MYEQSNNDSILEHSDRDGTVGSTDSGTDISNETNIEHITGQENINIIQNEEGTDIQSDTRDSLPDGCNIYYGTYIDNYNGSTRKRYYFDDYGQLILNNQTTSTSRPAGSVCMTEMPMSHNKDMGILAGEACAAIAIGMAVWFVLGRIIK